MTATDPAQARAVTAHARPAAPSLRAAPADGRLVALVSRVQVDGGVALPPSFSSDTFRRELEIALESTGLFKVPTREQRDLDPVIDEVVLTHRGSPRLVGAQFILNPAIESVTLDERRRRAPGMANKDLVTVTGAIALRVTVLMPSGEVQKRMSIDARYAGPAHLEDPLPNDQLVRSDAVHRDASTPDFVALTQATARAFAKRVLDQVNPVIVAQRTDNTIYLTRGEDAGYHIGDMLRIMRPGAEIRHPITHELLGRAEQQIGDAQVVEVQPKLSIAEIKHSTRDVVTGDIVREPIDEGDQQ